MDKPIPSCSAKALQLKPDDSNLFTISLYFAIRFDFLGKAMTFYSAERDVLARWLTSISLSSVSYQCINISKRLFAGVCASKPTLLFCGLSHGDDKKYDR